MKFCTALLCLLSYCGIWAQDMETLAVYGRNGDEQLSGLTLMPNGNILAVGIQSGASTSTIYDFYAFELGPDSVIWSRSYGGSLSEKAHDVVPALDGGYVLAGYTESSDGDIVTGNDGGTDVWLVKISETGILEWSQTYGSSGDDEALSIMTYDNAYFVAGYNSGSDGDVANNYGVKDAWLLKIDLDGGLIWEKNYGGSSFDEAVDLIFDADIQQFVMVGKSSSDDTDLTENKGGSDVWVARLDAEGDLLWQTSAGGSSADAGLSIAKTDDGGYAILASTVSDDGDVGMSIGQEDCWLLKLDAAGNIQWSKVFGTVGNDNAREVMADAIDGQLLVVEMAFYPGTSFDTRLLKFDVNNGNIGWDKNFGGSQYDFSNTMLQHPDGGILLGGYTDSFIGELGGGTVDRRMHGVHQAWVWKATNPPLGIKNGLENFDIGLFPNPNTNGIFTLSIKDKNKPIVDWTYQIYDVKGVVQLQGAINCPMGQCLSPIDASSLNQGIYFLHLQNKEGNQLIEKLVK